MKFIIKDLHCDLLEYLQQNADHTPYDKRARCSIPQLQKGGVKEQILAIFSETKPGSHFSGRRQVMAYQALKKQETETGIHWKLAIENGSAFFEEAEPIAEGIGRLRRWHRECGPLAYLSLTWNTANRFGGGALEPGPLTADGEQLLDFLAEAEIPLDLAHASDLLAETALTYSDKKKLPLRILYSHGELRAVRDVPRNLPDWLVEEILRRKGLVGLSFVRHFIGDAPAQFCQHVQALLDKGGAESICFGADFFYENSIPPEQRRKDSYFFEEWSDASCYPKVLQLLEEKLHLDEVQLNRLACQNIERFFQFIH